MFYTLQVGAKVTCRVLRVDQVSKRVTVTLKKSLVKDTLPAVTTYEQAERGALAVGYISKVRSYLSKVA
jgi:ribosomal protein S1